MKNNLSILISASLLLISVGHVYGFQQQQNQPAVRNDSSNAIHLPKPVETKSTVNHSNVIGWVEGKMPIAAAGFKVTRFADGFHNPRGIYDRGRYAKLSFQT